MPTNEPFPDPPEVSAVAAQLHGQPGWQVNISCLVWADPPASLHWLRGGRTGDTLDYQARNTLQVFQTNTM